MVREIYSLRETLTKNFDVNSTNVTESNERTKTRTNERTNERTYERTNGQTSRRKLYTPRHKCRGYKYVVHYKNLMLYLSLGMKLRRIHRVLEFDEKPWMEPYIRLNTEMRKKAKSAFEKDFYKLMNNSVFGKTMENLRKRVDIKLVKTDGSENEKLRKIIAKPTFKRRVKFSDELSAIHVNKTKLTLNKPVYVGFSVLDLSKHLMYDWYVRLVCTTGMYDWYKLKKKYGENCTLLTPTQIHYWWTSKQKTYTKTCLKQKTNMTFLIILKTIHFTMKQTKR